MNRQHSTKSQWSSFSVDFFSHSISQLCLCMCARRTIGSLVWLLLSRCVYIFAYFVSVAVCRRVVARALHLPPCIFISTACVCTLNLVFRFFSFLLFFFFLFLIIFLLLLHLVFKLCLSLDIYRYLYVYTSLCVTMHAHIFKLKIEHRIYKELIFARAAKRHALHFTGWGGSDRIRIE